MRILLVHNSLYYPSYGGGDKSNRLLMQALAARGHAVRVVARLETFGAEPHQRFLRELADRQVRASTQESSVHFELSGVDVRVLTRNGHLRQFLSAHIHAFDPDVILTSTDDPAQLQLETALRAERARVIYLIRAIIAAPFGPASSSPSETKTEALRQIDGAVGVSEYVAEYGRTWGGLNAVHVPISLLEPGESPSLGRFENRFVSMVNPCAAKGISIFLALADRFPKTPFAAVPSWGTTDADLSALRARSNITIFPALDDIDDLYRDTHVALVPSLWAEARSRIILEAMSRGIPVLASDVGGLREAMLGMDYILPVAPVINYQPSVNELMVPVAEIPEQDIGPWEVALRRLLTDREHYEFISARSRSVALAYARELSVGPFEAYLESVVARPRRPRQPKLHQRTLSAEQQKLLALRLRKASVAKTDKPARG
jgi:glycosyltransferase involved in cell wall biosynthesis